MVSINWVYSIALLWLSVCLASCFSKQIAPYPDAQIIIGPIRPNSIHAFEEQTKFISRSSITDIEIYYEAEFAEGCINPNEEHQFQDQLLESTEFVQVRTARCQLGEGHYLTVSLGASGEAETIIVHIEIEE